MYHPIFSSSVVDHETILVVSSNNMNDEPKFDNEYGVELRVYSMSASVQVIEFETINGLIVTSVFTADVK